MKKYLSIFAICLLSLLVVGCGCDKKPVDNVDEQDNGNQIEDTVKDLYTDDKKLVYDNESAHYTIVFYYNDDNEITGYEDYYECEDEEKAKEKYENDKEALKNDASIKEVVLSGKYVVYVRAGSLYEGKTVDDIKEEYSWLIPIYKD